MNSAPYFSSLNLTLLSLRRVALPVLPPSLPTVHSGLRFCPSSSISPQDSLASLCRHTHTFGLGCIPRLPSAPFPCVRLSVCAILSAPALRLHITHTFAFAPRLSWLGYCAPLRLVHGFAGTGCGLTFFVRFLPALLRLGAFLACAAGSAVSFAGLAFSFSASPYFGLPLLLRHSLSSLSASPLCPRSMNGRVPSRPLPLPLIFLPCH